MIFSNSARMLSLDKQDATLTVASRIEKMAECAGTDFHATFQQAEKHYKRVIILSGMQSSRPCKGATPV